MQDHRVYTASEAGPLLSIYIQQPRPLLLEMRLALLLTLSIEWILTIQVMVELLSAAWDYAMVLIKRF